MKEEIPIYSSIRHGYQLEGADYSENIRPGIERMKELGYTNGEINRIFNASPKGFSNIKLDRIQRVE